MCRSHSFFHFLKYTHIACSFHPPVLVLAQNHRPNHSSCFSSLLCRWSSLSVPINIFASVSVPLSLCLCICPCLCLSDPFPFAWNSSRGLRIPGPNDLATTCVTTNTWPKRRRSTWRKSVNILQNMT